MVADRFAVYLVRLGNLDAAAASRVVATLVEMFR